MPRPGFESTTLTTEAYNNAKRLSRILAATMDADVSMSDAILIAIREYYVAKGITYDLTDFNMIGIDPSKQEEMRVANLRAATAAVMPQSA